MVESDARKLEGHLGGASADLLFTSPPYGGTYDYVEHHARRYPWLGIRPNAMRRLELGARRHLGGGDGPGDRDAADAWDDEVVAYLKSIRRLTRPGSRIVLLVGDAQIGRVRVRAEAQLEALAPRARLVFVASASQRRPDFTGRRGREEHLVMLRVR